MMFNGLQLYGVCVCVCVNCEEQELRIWMCIVVKSVITVEEVIYSIYPQKIIMIIIFFAT